MPHKSMRNDFCIRLLMAAALSLVICGVAVGAVVASTEHEHHCIHDKMKQSKHYKEPHTQHNEYKYAKHTFHTEATGNIRIKVFFDAGSCSNTLSNGLPECSHCATEGQTVTTFGSSVTCTADDVLTTTKKNYIMDTLMPAAADFLSRALKVEQVSGNLVLGGDATCGFGHGVTIPAADTTTGIAAADFIVYISAVPNEDTNSTTFAWATACRNDQNGRPIASQVNFVPKRLTNAASPAISITSKDIKIAIHEIMHALGFSGPNFFSNGYLDLNGNKVTSDTGVIDVVERDHQVTKINTPRVLQRAREFYGCSTMTGMEIENQGGSGTAGSHWEKRVALYEGMAGTVSTIDIYFTTMTLAFFEDLGHYVADYTQAEDMLWGKNEGCDFVTKSCNDPALKDKGFWCWEKDANGNALDGCDYEARASSYCRIGTYSAALDSWYQYFSNPAVGGGDQTADLCPYFNRYSNGACWDPANAGSGDDLKANVYAAGSRCFSSNLLKVRYTPLADDGARCMQFRCQTSHIEVLVVDTYVSCPADGSAGAADVSSISGNWQGYINCPAFKLLCAGSSTPTTPITPTPVTTPTTPTTPSPPGTTPRPATPSPPGTTATPTPPGPPATAPPVPPNFTPFPGATPFPPVITVQCSDYESCAVRGLIQLVGRQCGTAANTIRACFGPYWSNCTRFAQLLLLDEGSINQCSNRTKMGSDFCLDGLTGAHMICDLAAGSVLTVALATTIIAALLVVVW